MDREVLLIISCLLLVVIIVYAFLTKKSRFESIKDEISPHEKNMLRECKPRKLEEVGKYDFYKFNWGKIIVLDLGILAFMIVKYFSSNPREQESSFVEMMIVTLVFVGLLTLAAFAIDYSKAGMHTRDKEYLYIYPVYKYDGVARNCILFYYDVHTCKIEGKAVRLYEEESFRNHGNGLYYAIMKVKNKKTKFIKIYDEQM